LSAIGVNSPTPRYEVYLFGYLAGRESLRARIDRLTWERDLYYFLMSNRGKTAKDYYSHQTSELWRQAVNA
jgi:hypothetical protein